MQLLLWARLLWPESYRTDLDDKLKADVILGSDSIADEQIVLARGNVRKLMGKCPERIAKSVCLETKTIMQDNYVSRKSTTCCKVLLGLWISLSKVCLHLLHRILSCIMLAGVQTVHVACTIPAPPAPPLHLPCTAPAPHLHRTCTPPRPRTASAPLAPPLHLSKHHVLHFQ